MSADDNRLFSQEYESIDPGHQFTWENSNLEVNKAKNRYANVVAYDHSRVILRALEGVPGSDYINANYIDGYKKPNCYIATQVSSISQTYFTFKVIIGGAERLSYVRRGIKKKGNRKCADDFRCTFI